MRVHANIMRGIYARSKIRSDIQLNFVLKNQNMEVHEFWYTREFRNAGKKSQNDQTLKYKYNTNIEILFTRTHTYCVCSVLHRV